MLEFKNISEYEMLKNWALAEFSSTRRWKYLTQGGIPAQILEKVKLSQSSSLTKPEEQILVDVIKQTRSPFLTGLLKLQPTWYKGALSINELEKVKMINHSPFVNLAKSRNLIDLVKAFEQGKMPSDHHEFKENLERIKTNFNPHNLVGSPIFVSQQLSPPIFLMEGFTRCSAILLLHREGGLKNYKLPIILGVSDRLDQWLLEDGENKTKLI